jgi:hypothetical protein
VSTVVSWTHCFLLNGDRELRAASKPGMLTSSMVSATSQAIAYGHGEALCVNSCTSRHCKAGRYAPKCSCKIRRVEHRHHL